MKKIIYIAAAVATLASCNKDNTEISTALTAVEFTEGVITRASGTEWAAGDEIGVYMFSTGSTTVVEDKGNIAYYNSKADAGTSATFNVVSSDEIIYYPQGEVAVDFLAYYPYDSAKVALNDFIYEVDVNDQSDKPAIDLMISDNLVGKYLSKSPLALNFTHSLSQLAVVVNSGIGEPSLDGLEITAHGLINSAEYDLTTSAIDFGATTANDLAVTNGEAIIIPQTTAISFTVKTTDNPTGFETSQLAITFNAGESTTITLTLNRTSVSFEGDAEITDWVNSGNDSTLDAEQPAA